MIAVQLMGRGRIELRELPEPAPLQDQVVVQIRASALCGSELHAFRGPHALENNLGHQAAGIVYAVDQARGVRPGDRVALFAETHCGRCVHCRAGDWILCESPQRPARYPGDHAEFVCLPESLCLPLPPDISFEAGALLGNGLGTPYHAVRRLGVHALDTVVITGQGPAGLHATLVCKFFGARVIAVEPRPARRELAASLGADAALDPMAGDPRQAIRDLTGGRGADKALDCSGTEEGQNLALDSLRRRGRMAFIGENPVATIRPSEQFIRKELEVFGSWYFNASEYDEMVEVVRRGAPIDRIVTHRFPLHEAQEAFDTFARGSSGAVLLQPSFTVPL